MSSVDFAWEIDSVTKAEEWCPEEEKKKGEMPQLYPGPDGHPHGQASVVSTVRVVRLALGIKTHRDSF